MDQASAYRAVPPAMAAEEASSQMIHMMFMLTHSCAMLCMLHRLEPATLFAAPCRMRSTHWSQSLAPERPVTFMLQRSMICNFAMASYKFLHCRSERHRSQYAAGCARSLWQKARRLVSYALVLTCFDQSNLVAGPAIDLPRYGLACSDRIKPNEFLTCTVMRAYICKTFPKTLIHLSQLIKLYAREIRHKA